MKTFEPKLFGQNIDVTYAAMLEAKFPEDMLRIVHERLRRNAVDTDKALAAKRGKWRFWYPRGLDWTTFTLVDAGPNMERQVLSFQWRAFTR